MRKISGLLFAITLAVGCANVSAEQEFEQAVRSYETYLKGTIAYYDADGDGVADRPVTNAERVAITTIVLSGRNIRDAGMDVVLECKAEQAATGKDKCSSAPIILHSAEALMGIAKAMEELHFSEEN